MIVKKLSPKTFLVGFKLLNGVEEYTLFNVAFDLLRKNRCNLVIANDLQLIKQGKHTGLLVYPEKKYDKLVGKEQIAKQLVDTMFKRGASRHPNSIQLANVNEVEEDELATFYETGKQLFQRQLLPIVEGGTYGNISIRKGKGFIITGRNVQKGNLTNDILVSIDSVEELTKEENEDVFAKVYYKGGVKPSIDSAIHHFIYKKTNHNAILHVHTDQIFSGLPLTTYNYACGTEDEMNSILDCITKHEDDIIQMYKHGLIVIGDTLQDCYAKLDRLLTTTINLDPANRQFDQNELDEWFAHYEEVKPANKPFDYDFQNNDRYWIVKQGNEKVATLFVQEENDALTFVLYGLHAKRKSGGNIAGHTISILSTLAKNKNIPKLRIITVNECHVSSFYQKKHGFTLVKTVEDEIVLEKYN